MTYIKKFQDNIILETYKKSNFVSPHVYLNNTEKTFDYMPKYQILDYISSTSTGGQYIDLGCHLMENTDDIQIDIKFNIKGHGKTGQGQSTLIASQPEVNPYPGFVLRIPSKGFNNTVEVTLNNKWMCSKDWLTYMEGGSKHRWAYKYMAPMDGIGSQVISGGELCYTRTINEYSIILDDIPQEQINNFSCHLFCALDSSNNPFRFIEADLYYLKFTKGGQVVRNLIPVKKLSTNEIGLYDLENDHLYVSQGNEPFVAGPNK